jgi:hypothetical protein
MAYAARHQPLLLELLKGGTPMFNSNGQCILSYTSDTAYRLLVLRTHPRSILQSVHNTKMPLQIIILVLSYTVSSISIT